MAKRTLHLPGLRNIKTVLAVLSCLLFYMLLEFFSGYLQGAVSNFAKTIYFILNRNEPLFACVAAIVAMQSTIEDSWERGTSRIIGTFIGGVLGLLLIYAGNAVTVADLSVIIIPIGVFIAIYISNIIGRSNAAAFAAINLVIILITTGKTTDPAHVLALNRTIDTAIGVLISMVVNFGIRRPKRPEKKTRQD
ncbi:MAG: FUSC family protein [Oscillospiraceae bacterium]|nr:FUSC family protein [Oscillospiraceae bacterium]